jgi:hypothetical protein
MNERIKTLAKQSLPEFYLTNCPSALEKFAELIIRECVDYAFSDEYERSEMFKHFGVKP